MKAMRRSYARLQMQSALLQRDQPRMQVPMQWGESRCRRNPGACQLQPAGYPPKDGYFTSREHPTKPHDQGLRRTGLAISARTILGYPTTSSAGWIAIGSTVNFQEEIRPYAAAHEPLFGNIEVEMKAILETLVNTLLERFDAAGFNVPKALTEKERESFVFQTLEQAAILPQADFDALVVAAFAVVNRWEKGDLAAAVRNLGLVLAKVEEGIPDSGNG